jgi:beta-fructofuranosidase
MLLFYQHEEKFIGDIQPFFWNGELHLFYIKPDENSWRHIGTRDLVHFEDYGVAIPSGGPRAQDKVVASGSVLENRGVFHIFYTGLNGDSGKVGLPFPQVQMHATSTDLVHWEKDADWRLPPQLDEYSAAAWRDPYVFWNAEVNEWWMIIASTRSTGVPTRCGCSALCVSKDLVHWEAREPVYAPGLYDTHECPDLFQMGDWWYLIFCTYNQRWETRYRMARGPGGPWITPADDMLDGRAFFAAKTASDGNRRWLIGWLAQKEPVPADAPSLPIVPVSSPTEGLCWLKQPPFRDSNAYAWGGCLVLHELVQHADGTLGACLPNQIESSFARAVPLAPSLESDSWKKDKNNFRCDSPDTFSLLQLAPMPSPCLLRAQVKWEAGTQSLGFLLRMCSLPPVEGLEARREAWYQVRLEPKRNRVVFDRSNRYHNDCSFIEERPVVLGAEGSAELKVVAAGSAIVVYVNALVALSVRGYDLENGGAGLFVSEGRAEFRQVELRSL